MVFYPKSKTKQIDDERLRVFKRSADKREESTKNVAVEKKVGRRMDE